MNLEAILKAQGLSDEQISSILKGMKDNKIYTTSLENIDVRYQRLKEQKEDAENQLKTTTATIEDLKKGNVDNETLQKTIKEHEITIETLKAESTKKEFDMVINNALKDCKARDINLVKALLNEEGLKINGNEVIGLKEQLETIKKEKDYLFEKEVPGTGSFTTGGGYEPPTDTNFASELGKQKAEVMKAKSLTDFAK